MVSRLLGVDEVGRQRQKYAGDETAALELSIRYVIYYQWLFSKLQDGIGFLCLHLTWSRWLRLRAVLGTAGRIVVVVVVYIISG